MRQSQRNIKWLILGISGLSGLAWFMNGFPPDSMTRIVEFFLIIFATSFVITQFFLNNVRRASFISIGLIIFLILRALGLHDPIYVILLIASLISLEVLMAKR